MAQTLSDTQLDLLLDPTKEREWIEALLNIESEDAGVIPWVTTEQQKRILETSRRIRRLLIVKGRQTRCSTALMGKAVRRATTSYGSNFVIITQTDKMTQNFRTFIRRRFEDLAEKGLPYEFGRDNESVLELKGMRNTFHFASAEQKVGLRGIQTAHWVHASEVAHWPEDSAKRILGGILPAIPPGGFFVAESTPNGAAGWFYDRCMDSMPLVPVSAGGWTVAFYPWWLEQKYTIATYETMLRDAGVDTEKLRFDFIPSPVEETLMQRYGLTVDRILWRRIRSNDLIQTGQYFAQEYPEDLLSCWLSAGVCFFHDDQFDHLSYYREQVKNPARKYQNLTYRDPVTGIVSDVDFLGQNLQVWEEPVPGTQYVAFQDTSAGVAVDGDYSALSILDVGRMKHVATLRVRTIPGRVGRMAAAVGAWYNWAFLGVERNTYGAAALEALAEMHYPNLYYDVINQPNAPEVGWYTSPTSRELMLNRFREHVFSHRFGTCDTMAVMEMGGFTWHKVQGRSGNITFRAEADRGNDDMVISLAGACAIAPYAPMRVRSGTLNITVGPSMRRANEDILVGPGGVVVTGMGRDQNLPWLGV